MEYKTIILDRDGVINKLRKDYVKSVSEIEFINRSIEAINILLSLQINVIVASNQSCVGRGIISKIELDKITTHINSKLIKNIDFNYCVHRPEDQCECRKPKAGLINLIKSTNDGPFLFVGDNISDYYASKSACVDFALVKTGYGVKFASKLQKKCQIYNDLFNLVQRIQNEEN